MHPGPCVGCGCTADRACLGPDGLPCAWADERDPVCTTCAEKFPAGALVMIALGPRTGRRGVVKRAPKLFLAHRYVDLDATERAGARRQLFHIHDLVGVAS